MAKVLVVDDEADKQKAFKRMLQEDADVVVVDSPEAALKTIREGERFTHVLSDRDLGATMNGVGLLGEIFERHLLDAKLALTSGMTPTAKEMDELARIGAKFFPKTSDAQVFINWIKS